MCNCALLCNRCVIYAGCDIILNPPACFLISLQEGSSADSESVPQKVIHTLPVYYKHQAAACLSSLYFALLSVCLTAVFPFASPHETTPSCLILCVWSPSCFGQSLLYVIVCLLYPLCFLLCLCLWNICVLIKSLTAIWPWLPLYSLGKSSNTEIYTAILLIK